jgi:cytochrome c-type biogenesis protein CcmE
VKRIVYGGLGVAVLAVAGFMIWQAIQSSLVYFVLPSEYAVRAETYEDRRIRLGGIVEAGSVAFDDAGLQLVFRVTDTIDSYQVHHKGAPPELFEENQGVVVEGTFRNGVFESDTLLVKHSEVYQAPGEGRPVDIEQLKDTLQ